MNRDGATDERPCLAFVHIPKTAGTTLRGVIQWHYRGDPERIIKLYGDRPSKDLESIPVNLRAQARVVIGHFSYGIHEYLPQECLYITFLREPVERVLASFRWMIQRPGQPFYSPREKDGGLKAFLAKDRTVDNGQTRVLSSIRNQAVSRVDLETAKRNLEEFLVVGLTERFDESFLLLRKVLGWHNPFYITRNVAPDWSHHIPVSEESMDLIKERNQLDVELYEFASGLLHKAVANRGISFQRELQLCMALNKVGNSIGDPVERLVRGYVRSPLARSLRTRWVRNEG